MLDRKLKLGFFLVYDPLHVEFSLSEIKKTREQAHGIIKKKQRRMIFKKKKTRKEG